jgi:hypothetical protein
MPEVMDASDEIPYEFSVKFEPTRSGRSLRSDTWKCPGDSATRWPNHRLRVLPSTIYVVTVNTGDEYAFFGDGLRVPIVSGDIGSVAERPERRAWKSRKLSAPLIQNCNYYSFETSYP